jgi:phosphohistidine phosphatase SixA
MLNQMWCCASPLVRTRETAEILVEQFGCELKFTDTLAPGVTAANVWKSVARYPQAEQIFLVGHEPDMGMLVRDLVFAGPEFEMPFKKGRRMPRRRFRRAAYYARESSNGCYRRKFFTHSSLMRLRPLLQQVELA